MPRQFRTPPSPWQTARKTRSKPKTEVEKVRRPTRCYSSCSRGLDRTGGGPFSRSRLDADDIPGPPSQFSQEFIEVPWRLWGKKRRGIRESRHATRGTMTFPGDGRPSRWEVARVFRDALLRDASLIHVDGIEGALTLGRFLMRFHVCP